MFIVVIMYVVVVMVAVVLIKCVVIYKEMCENLSYSSELYMHETLNTVLRD